MSGNMPFTNYADRNTFQMNNSWENSLKAEKKNQMHAASKKPTLGPTGWLSGLVKVLAASMMDGLNSAPKISMMERREPISQVVLTYTHTHTHMENKAVRNS